MNKRTGSRPGQEILQLEGVELPAFQPTPPPADEIQLYGVGPHSEVIDGWKVLDKAIKDIARHRSNMGFLKLPETSKPVKRFAETIEQDTPETLDLVKGTVRDHSGNRRLTHYQRAQWRLNELRRKQQIKVRKDPQMQKLGLEEVDNMLPLSVGEVEHRFFYALNPEEEKAKAAKRRKLAAFVSKHI